MPDGMALDLVTYQEGKSRSVRLTNFSAPAKVGTRSIALQDRSIISMAMLVLATYVCHSEIAEAVVDRGPVRSSSVDCTPYLHILHIVEGYASVTSTLQ